jgi:hypothetical protein
MNIHEVKMVSKEDAFYASGGSAILVGIVSIISYSNMNPIPAMIATGLFTFGLGYFGMRSTK